MKRIRFHNKFLNSKSDTDRKAYNAQRNLCVSLIRQANKQFFSNLNTRDATDYLLNFLEDSKTFIDRKS